MKVQCPKCDEIHTVNPDRIPPTGATAKCKACGSPFRIEKEPGPEDPADQVTCPKCGHDQPKADTCTYCGVIFGKVKKQPAQSNAVQDEEQEAQKDQDPEPDQSEHAPPMATGEPGNSKAILYIMVAAIVVFISWAGYSRYAEGRYIDRLWQTTGKVLGSSQTCLKMCGEYKNAWDVAIKTGLDFNTMLEPKFHEFKSDGKLDLIKKEDEAIIVAIKELSGPPNAHKAAYEKLVRLYGEYHDLSGLASSPSGSFQSYSNAIATAESQIARLISEIMVMVP